MSELSPYRPWSRWNRVRQQVLARDEWLCQVRTLCTGARATDVDHIVPWRDGGDWFALSNLRASCKACNISRASHQKHRQGWKRANVEIVLVDDPSLVDDVDDSAVVIEVDRLVGAVAPGRIGPQHRQVAAAALASIVRELTRGELLTSGRVYLVATSPDCARQWPHHRIERAGGSYGSELEQGQGHEVEPGRW